MKKFFKFIAVILALTVTLGCFAACTPTDPEHTCQSKCITCGKCTDLTCDEAACADKCQGHSQTPPAHSCESVCPECGKCLDSACTEAACADKCGGHVDLPEIPVHKCESKCEVCQKCTDADCTEPVCDDKCQGHEEVNDAEIYTDISLMSFNIRQQDQWASRKDAFMKFLNETDATVICMQEVKQGQVGDIREGLKGRFEFIYYARESGSNPEGLGILYDKNVWSLVSEYMFWLSETPDVMSKGWGASYYRICVNLLLQHKETGAKLSVYNVHLDHQVELARVNGMNLVLEKIEDERYPAYVCGDMNCTVNTPAIEAMTKVMTDCQAEASITEGGNTYNGWDTTVNPDALAIDFCFVSKNLMLPISFDICREKYTVTADGITFSEDSGSLLSDHYAVKTTVRWLYKLSGSNTAISKDGFDGEMETVNK